MRIYSTPFCSPQERQPNNETMRKTSPGINSKQQISPTVKHGPATTRNPRFTYPASTTKKSPTTSPRTPVSHVPHSAAPDSRPPPTPSTSQTAPCILPSVSDVSSVFDDVPCFTPSTTVGHSLPSGLNQTSCSPAMLGAFFSSPQNTSQLAPSFFSYGSMLPMGFPANGVPVNMNNVPTDFVNRNAYNFPPSCFPVRSATPVNSSMLPFAASFVPRAAPEEYAASYDRYLVQRVQQQESEIANLHMQLQHCLRVYNDLLNKTPVACTSATATVICHTSSQTDPVEVPATQDIATMTENFGFAGNEAQEQHRDMNHRIAEDPEYFDSESDEENVHLPAPGTSNDLSIACNNLAQKYLKINPNCAPLHTESRKPSNNGSVYGMYSRDVSFATRNYLERHNLTGSGNGGRAAARVVTESIIEWTEGEDDDDVNADPESLHFPLKFMNAPQQSDPFRQDQRSVKVREKQTREMFVGRQGRNTDFGVSRQQNIGEVADRPERNVGKTLDIERLQHLPKLVPKNLSS